MIIVFLALDVNVSPHFLKWVDLLLIALKIRNKCFKGKEKQPRRLAVSIVYVDFPISLWASCELRRKRSPVCLLYWSVLLRFRIRFQLPLILPSPENLKCCLCITLVQRHWWVEVLGVYLSMSEVQCVFESDVMFSTHIWLSWLLHVSHSWWTAFT